MSQQRDVDSQFVKVPKILQQEASIGPIPADQLVPWTGFIVIGFFVAYILLGLSLQITGLLIVWLISSWWLLTGKKSYKYTDLWIMPNSDWISLPRFWVSADDKGAFKHDAKERKQLRKAVSLPYTDGKQLKKMSYKPFQSESHLQAQLRISIGGSLFDCWLLNEGGDKWSATIPFKFKGLHPQLYRGEVAEQADALADALKEMPPGERLTMMMGCYRNTAKRSQNLEHLAQTCQMKPISVLLANENNRVEELDADGLRKHWEQYVFCTWSGTVAAEGPGQKESFAATVLKQFSRNVAKTTRSFMGTEDEWQASLYCQLAAQIYDNGYMPWKLLLETKANLQVEPFQGDELWHWLWYRFNGKKTTPPPIPQLIEISETEKGLERNIIHNSERDLISTAVQGVNGNSSCPQHGGTRDKVYLNHTIASVLAMETPPEGWRSIREQLQWQFQCLSSTYVYDTEAWCEIEVGSKLLMRENLKKIAKQAESSNRHVVETGGGLDVGSMVRQEESFDAQRKLYTGAAPLYVAPVYVVYRDSEDELAKAANLMTRSFGNAVLVKETNVAWRLYTETLPFNRFKLLCSTSMFTNRRIMMDSDTTPGLLPLTRYRPVHKKGVELLTEHGGQPIYVDLFARAERAIITAASGGGKSVFGWRFVMDALAQNIPIVGIDISTGGESTFKTAAKMLGDQAAFFQMATEAFNLVEPPDVQHMESKAQQERLRRWKQFLQQALVEIVMGKIEHPMLRERVDSLIVKMIQGFTANPHIIDRYNTAFAGGFHSEAWQKMPTLHDMVKFCSKEKLGLKSVEDLDRQAINQIVNQLDAKLHDPEIGHAIGRPSTIPPSPKMKIFALSGMNNESNASVMALLAAMACITNGLSHSRSLFVGDELSVLLAKHGFADMVGTLFATGRKDGISCLILAQDLEAIRECSAAAKIFQNTSVEMVGRTTTSALKTYVDVGKFDEGIIARNATEAFYPNANQYFTRWTLKMGNRYWSPLRYYPGAMTLAAVANSEDEKAARNRYMAQYDESEIGMIKALRDFSRDYIKSLRGSVSIREIGPDNQKQPVSTH